MSVVALVGLLLTLFLVPVGAAPQHTNTYDGPLEYVVADWNMNAVHALINPATAEIAGVGQTAPVSALHLAMVHGAIYDAVNAIDGGYQPYLGNLPTAPRSASKAAAVATAAHDVLVGISFTPALTPAIVDRIHGLRDTTIAAALAADGRASVDVGITIGQASAATMLAARVGDGRYGSFRFTAGTKPGEWRPTTVDTGGNPVSDPNAWVARVKPFTLESASQFRTMGPSALTSDAYTRDYNEVKALGSTTSARTPAQQALTEFYVNATNPVELFNRAFRTIVREQKLTLVDQARLFAMLNMAGADSLIGCWDDKTHWSFWRPMTAIREGENDGNPQTAGDPAWTPWQANPPYPEHPSGYNCVTAAYMHTARAFWGKDDLAFSVIKIAPNTPDVTRTYARFSDVIRDTIDARIYQGHHFRTADTQGAGLGQQVAERLATRYFQRVPGLPSTGAGGRASAALVPIGPLSALALAAVGIGWGLRRRVRRLRAVGK